MLLLCSQSSNGVSFHSVRVQIRALPPPWPYHLQLSSSSTLLQPCGLHADLALIQWAPAGPLYLTIYLTEMPFLPDIHRACSYFLCVSTQSVWDFTLYLQCVPSPLSYYFLLSTYYHHMLFIFYLIPTWWTLSGQGFCLPDSLLNLLHLEQWLAHGRHSISILSSLFIKDHSDLLFTVYPLLSYGFWYTFIPYSNFKLKKRKLITLE